MSYDPSRGDILARAAKEVTRPVSNNNSIRSTEKLRGAPVTWLDRITIAGVLAGIYGAHFLYFLLPSVQPWLLVGSALLLIPLFLASVAALFRLRWKLILVFAVAWTLVALPFTGMRGPFHWLNAQGFHLYTLLAGDYPSRCQMIEFAEEGAKQRVGGCGVNAGFVYSDYDDYIVYDTTGEVALPFSERTQDWKDAASKAIPHLVVSRGYRGTHLFGNYYSIAVTVLDFGD